MKKICTIITLACLCVGLASAKGLPKIKESSFGNNAYVQNIIKSYELTRDDTLSTTTSTVIYDKVERYINGDNFVEYAEMEDEDMKSKVNYVGMNINGVYKSRVWYEMTFREGGAIEAALYEDSPNLSSGGTNGDYELSADAELFYIFDSISFRTLIRNSIQSAYPEKILQKDAEISEVFTQFYQSESQDEALFNKSAKKLQEITKKYKGK